MHPLLRIRIHVYLLFTALGLFVPFQAVYFAQRGLTDTEIGLLGAMTAFVGLVTQPFIGFLADYRHAHRGLLVLLCLLTGILCPLLILPDRFIEFAPILLVISVCFSPIIPLADSMTFGIISKQSGATYGGVRVWGTLGYLIICILGGLLVDGFGFPFLYGSLSAALILTAFSAHLLPAIARPFEPLRFSHAREILTNRNVVIFMICGFIVQGFFTSGVFYLGPLMDSYGSNMTGIGLAWALAVLTELPMMAWSGRITSRWGLKPLIGAGILLAALRWLVMAATTNINIIVLIQMLHGLTFGALHAGAVNFMDRMTPAPARAVGQSLYSTFVMSGGRILGLLTAAWLTGIWGQRYFFAISAVLTLIAGLCFLAWVAEPDPIQKDSR